ncbi:hypothetical protein HRI_001921600 [Hibiscus trionum]|uniref:Reverse transcriptase zinc-binding domain-containing protein n=1 Tax=Hibiscus trionum TaxID=183268 RepID=A0A9W7HTL3_HIBTR|nr:hypothetical protein HRI_001921600 [Hibiscus trionum]
MQDGRWCSDADELRAHAVKFYADLYTSEPRQPNMGPMGDFFAYRREELNPMLADVTRDEARCSRVWKGLASVWSEVQNGICWNVRDGMLMDFWFGTWLDEEGPLASFCVDPSVIVPVRVAGMVTDAGDWNWSVLAHHLPEDILLKLAAVPPPRRGFGEDNPGWRWNKSRCFSVKLAYTAIQPATGGGVNAIWKLIWSLRVPRRVQSFLWLAAHERLLTNVERMRRHMASSPSCGICGDPIEDVVHAVRDCSKAKEVWRGLVPSAAIARFFTLPLQTWLFENLSSDTAATQGGGSWEVLFVSTCWLLWKDRCRRLLDVDYVENHCFLPQCRRVAAEFFEAARREHVSAMVEKPVVHWCRPAAGWIKANTDAAVNPISHRASVGEYSGIARDDGSLVFIASSVFFSSPPDFPPRLKAIRAAGANQSESRYSMDYGDGPMLGDKALQPHGGEKPHVWSSLEGGSQYKPETFESLAYEGTIRKLVYDLGYPQELLEWTFDWKYMVRGLVLDKKRGNILKMDRHKYVKVAYHGFTELSKEDKVGIYGNTLIRDTFDEPDYALIDTLFSLAEAYMFAQLVDFRDKNPGKVPDYSHMYKDVRAAVDLCHRDGTLKQMVAKDPKRYINEDTCIVPMLKMLRNSGRSTFLVTNSLWDYTNIVMNFLCASHTLDGEINCNFDWLQYFDVVITGSAKPGFFLDNHANIFEVEPESGMLLNTDNGTPMPQVGNTSPKLLPKGLSKTCRVFQGGCVGHLHKLLSVESSSQVLYVGDHIYGDILRSKKVLGWRTMLVVPELEREVELLWELRDRRKQLRLLRNDRVLVEDQVHHLKWSLKFESLGDDEKQNMISTLGELESRKHQVRLAHQQAQRDCHQKFHKIWGQLMKTGYQNSRFAHQVERFACLYTSQVSNLSLYSPDKYYRPSEDFMPHEFDIFLL